MDIVMPQLGETVTEGTLTVWHKKPGDWVEANELLFEVSTDKVDTEIPAPASGTAREVVIELLWTMMVSTIPNTSARAAVLKRMVSKKASTRPITRTFRLITM